MNQGHARQRLGRSSWTSRTSARRLQAARRGRKGVPKGLYGNREIGARMGCGGEGTKAGVKDARKIKIWRQNAKLSKSIDGICDRHHRIYCCQAPASLGGEGDVGCQIEQVIGRERANRDDGGLTWSSQVVVWVITGTSRDVRTEDGGREKERKRLRDESWDWATGESQSNCQSPLRARYQ